jgi:hypothetical protein
MPSEQEKFQVEIDARIIKLTLQRNSALDDNVVLYGRLALAEKQIEQLDKELGNALHELKAIAQEK